MNEGLNTIMQKLADCTIDYSVNQIIGELSLVVERLGFAEFRLDNPASVQKDLETIDFLLSRDVSPGTVEFVKFLAETNHLGVVLKDAGLMFIGYCQAHFSEMKQITFRSAIEMSPGMRRHIRVMLMKRYAVSTRILFEQEPSLVAGFCLYDAKGIIRNYSLREQGVKLIDKYLRKRLPFPWNQTVA